MPDPGATVQMTRMQLDPGRVDAGLAFVRDELLQRLSTCSGLCSVELLINRVIGNGLLVTTWIDQEAADCAQALLDGLREDAKTVRGPSFPAPSRTCWSGDPHQRTDASTSFRATIARSQAIEAHGKRWS